MCDQRIVNCIWPGYKKTGTPEPISIEELVAIATGELIPTVGLCLFETESEKQIGDWATPLELTIEELVGILTWDATYVAVGAKSVAVKVAAEERTIELEEYIAFALSLSAA